MLNVHDCVVLCEADRNGNAVADDGTPRTVLLRVEQVLRQGADRCILRGGRYVRYSKALHDGRLTVARR